MPDPAEAFLALTGKIARERGFGAGSYRESCLRRRIAVRMRARGTGDYTTYSRLLDSDPSEYDRLLDALTINVTKLFRNHDAWEALERTALPALWTLRAPRIHCWVAGCASGEEAYTLAALWWRFTAANRCDDRVDRVRIVATDIDRSSLDAARGGAYSAAAMEETPDDVRRHHFSPGPPHAASAALRRLVTFEQRDLLLDPPPAGPLHLITCRNVIIYFDRASQDRLMQRFHDALVPGGYLMLGMVETLLGPSRALFEVVDQRQRIFRRP